MPRTIATISAIEQFIDETQTIQRTTVTAQFSPSLDDDPLHHPLFDDDDVYRYYIRWRLKLEGETENMGVC